MERYGNGVKMITEWLSSYESPYALRPDYLHVLRNRHQQMGSVFEYFY